MCPRLLTSTLITYQSIARASSPGALTSFHRSAACIGSAWSAYPVFLLANAFSRGVIVAPTLATISHVTPLILPHSPNHRKTANKYGPSTVRDVGITDIITASSVSGATSILPSLPRAATRERTLVPALLLSHPPAGAASPRLGAPMRSSLLASCTSPARRRAQVRRHPRGRARRMTWLGMGVAIAIVCTPYCGHDVASWFTHGFSIT